MFAGGLVAGVLVLFGVRAWTTWRPDGVVLLTAAVLAAGSEPFIPRKSLDAGLVVFALGAAVVAATAWSTREDDRGIVPFLLPATLGGFYACLPDVERPLVAWGASFALAALALYEPARRVLTLGPGALTGGVLVWIALVGGRGRPAADVGALACVGLVAVWPLAARLVRRPRGSGHRVSSLLIAAVVQVPLCIYCSRVAGLRESTREALVLAAPAVGVAFLFAVLFVYVNVMPTRPEP